VFNEKGQVIHIAPNAYRVSELMNDLFEWLKTSNVHYLIKSSIFHYEFEFIHPFQDGNGRIGRLWQSVILTHWKSIFVWIPIESIIKTKQQEYYDSIAYSNQAGNSNTFILFMLEVILDAVNNVINDVNDHVNHINSQITNLLFVMKDYPLKAKEIMDLLGLKSLSSFKINYLIPALEAGLIKMTIPEKPTSKNQQYYKC
jgi:Fic family protein